MKTCSVAKQYVDRIFGVLPVPKKNILYFECSSRNKDNLAPHGYVSVKQETLGISLKGWEKGTWTRLTVPKDGVCPYCGEKIVIHERGSRIFRFAAESLPTEKDTTSKEIKNSVYPEFKKWLPDFLIKRDGSNKRMDITIRNPAITILDPFQGKTFFEGTENETVYKGGDIVVEFVSYNQETQAGAGVQRVSCWMDEHANFNFFEEQLPRLLAEDGDVMLTLTPAMGYSWEYDDIFEKAQVYVRTKAICEFLSDSRKTYDQIEQTDSELDIAVIQAATDDNPTLSRQVVDEMYANTPDPDGTVVPTRRYGIFKQATGKIFKDFNYNVHVIDPRTHGLSIEMIRGWTLGVAQDWHQRTPHAIIWAAMSPDDECFIYREWNPSPEKWVTKDICEGLAKRSIREKFVIAAIDPLANTPNPDTAKTTIEEMNKHLHALKREVDGFLGMHFGSWKSRGAEGRDAIKERLANSLRVGKPFNNIVVEGGIKVRLPTIWLCVNPKESGLEFEALELGELEGQPTPCYKRPQTGAGRALEPFLHSLRGFVEG
jgi:hypothetical protein